MSDERKVLVEFRRNAEDTMRIALSAYRGRTYVDVRLFYTDANGELQPTKKGVTVTPELWDAFRAGITAAEAELEARGLWHPEGD